MAKPTTNKNNNTDKSNDSGFYRTRLLDLRARLRGEMGRMADAALGQGRSEPAACPSTWPIWAATILSRS